MPSDRCLPVCPVLSVTLVYCGQTVGWIKIKLGMRVALVPGHIVLDGDPAPPPSKEHSPQILAHICCGQMSGWIKMPLGMDTGLGSSDSVTWGPSSLFPKREWRPLPNFRPIFTMAKWLDGSRWHMARRWALVQSTLC